MVKCNNAFLFLLGSTLASSVNAGGLDHWHYNGFVSQSAINTSDNYFFGPSDDGVNLDFRELALIINGNPFNSISVAAQLLSRKAGVADDGAPRIDYGLISWRFQDGVDVTQGLSLGRIKVPFGFFNDTRESPFGRMGIFLPQSVYGDRYRNSTMTADELLYFGEYRNAEWTVGVKTGYGRSNPDRDELMDVFRSKVQLEQLQIYRTEKWNFQLLADYDGGRFRAGFSRMLVPVDFSGNFRVSPTFVLQQASVLLTYMNLISLEWNQDAISLTSEIHKSVVNYGDLPVDVSNPDYKDYPEGGYVQLKWHATPTWDLYAREDIDYFNQKDRDGKKYAAIQGVDAFSRFVYDRTIGVAYRPRGDWLIMAELHRVNGTMWLTLRDTPDNYTIKQYWDMAAVSVAWRF